MNVTLAFDEILDFLANGMTSKELADFHASEATNLRVEYLIRKEKNDGLTEAETHELDSFMQFNHFITLAKAKARAKLTAQ